MSMNRINKIFKDYNVMFFNDRQILKFIKVHYFEHYRFYKQLISINKIMGIDFFRYLAIYHYGGFYLIWIWKLINHLMIY